MKKSPSYFNALSRKETRIGLIYMAISLILLPSLLQQGNAMLASPLSSARLNFVYYCINFLVVVWIFRYFLKDSFRAALRSPFATIWYAALGYLGSEALCELLTILIFMIFPSFSNINDQTVFNLLGQEQTLIAIGTVIMVPVTEELFFRGLLFRNLWDKKQVLAYAVSMGSFALLHVVGYIGSFDPLHLLLCFVQYLPAGFCLCWCYRQTGTIATPIIMHAIVNAMGVSSAMR